MLKLHLLPMKRFLTILIIFTIAITGCKKNNLKKINYFPNIDNAPDVQILGINSLYYTDKKLKIKIQAPENDFYMKNRNNPRMEFPKGITAVFYNDKLQPISTIRADFAIYYQKLKLWKISGNVEVVNQAGARLRTQELYYDENQQKIFSIKFVEVYDTSGSIIRGKNGFISNLQFTDYQFRNVDGLVVTYRNLTNQ